MVVGMAVAAGVALIVPRPAQAPAAGLEPTFTDAEVCRSVVGALYNRDPAGVTARPWMGRTRKASYETADGRTLATKCRVEGSRVEWAKLMAGGATTHSTNR
jgi:hypothetical protein